MPEEPKIPCPFVYANGKACTGHVVRIEAYKADVFWRLDEDERWRFDFRPRSHYHLFCSEKGNHAGYRRNDPSALKYWLDHLPDELQNLIQSTKPSQS